MLVSAANKVLKIVKFWWFGIQECSPKSMFDVWVLGVERSDTVGKSKKKGKKRHQQEGVS